MKYENSCDHASVFVFGANISQNSEHRLVFGAQYPVLTIFINFANSAVIDNTLLTTCVRRKRKAYGNCDKNTGYQKGV